MPDDRALPGCESARGRNNGIDHPMWSDGSPILVGQLVRWHVTDQGQYGWSDGIYNAVVHEVNADEIRIGGMLANDEEWEEQVGPDELSLEHIGGPNEATP